MTSHDIKENPLEYHKFADKIYYDIEIIKIKPKRSGDCNVRCNKYWINVMQSEKTTLVNKDVTPKLTSKPVYERCLQNSLSISIKIYSNICCCKSRLPNKSA